MKTIYPSSPRSKAEAEQARQIVTLGLESVGKTQLLARLSGRFATPENYRGSTLACDSYTDSGFIWIDTPGIFRGSETQTSSETRKAVAQADQVLLVVRADHAADQLLSLIHI